MIKNKFPVISIIIPVYNAGKYLGKCLHSLCRQSLSDIEIICVNDGSSDDSLDIINNIAVTDKRIISLTQPNSGPARARNLGLQHARGKYIMFCDSDDWYEPNMCQIMLSRISSSDIVVCNANVIDETPDTTRTDAIGYYKNRYTGIKTITKFIIRQTNVVLWNKIFKKDIIDQYGITFPDGREYDDDCFYLQYMSVIQTADFCNEKLYNYLRRNDSIMGKVCSKKDKSIFDRLYAAKHYYDFICRHNLKQKCYDIFLNYLLRSVTTGKRRWNQTELQNAEEISLSLFGKKITRLAFPHPRKIAFFIKLEKSFNIKFRENKTVYKTKYTLFVFGIKLFSWKINMSSVANFNA